MWRVSVLKQNVRNPMMNTTNLSLRLTWKMSQYPPMWTGVRCPKPPIQANSIRSCVIVLSAVVLFIMSTSSHFEWLSATTKNTFPFFSAKSTCTLCHGLRGATGGAILCREHAKQLITISSMSLSIPGHHMKLRAMDFMLTIPGWTVCISWSRCSVYVDGMTTLLPQTMNPSSRDSSSFQTNNEYSSSPLAHDLCHICRVWSDSTNAQRCIRAAVLDGIPVLGPHIFVSRRWSVLMVLMEFNTIDDSQCLTFDLGVVSLCGTQWWWWLVFYGDFWALGRLNGPCGTQCLWGKCNGFFHSIWQLMADHSFNSIWACIRGKNEWLAFIVVSTVSLDNNALHWLNASSQALSQDHSTPAFK